jgi:phosphatidylserine/phosphatidylglycerophosphate/cardiolipin synthase-like enzyme
MQTYASSFVPLWHRQSEWVRRIEMVRAARAFLYQSLFYIEYDVYGRQMLSALLEAQKRGVRVQLIIDHFGQRLGGVLMTRAERAGLEQAIGELRRAGASVIF